jgi:cbb3-type cytochrome oxidase subunit 3
MSVPGGGGLGLRVALGLGIASGALEGAGGSWAAAALAGGALVVGGKGAQAESSATRAEPTDAPKSAHAPGRLWAEAPKCRRADNAWIKGAVGVAEGKVTMWLIVEAFLALALLLFAVWWTMFSGRRKGERPGEHDSELPPPQ